ncbi:hypothetical protein FB45DRAFT_751236, partial [Roridomyces roridus]
LHRHAALEAIYDSAESFPQPRCHPETRINLLNDLRHQLDDPGVRVLWLHGPAGAGKSAIMQTLCRQLHDSGKLGGSYFFKRDHGIRGNARGLFATLAYQLAIFDPTLKPGISKMVEKNPALVSTSIPSQLQQLIVEPCRLVPDRVGRILLIDELDECDGIAVQQEILRSIHSIFCAHTLPLKLVIASRPEPDIRELFKSLQTGPRVYGLHMTNIQQSFRDVHIYLRREFARIHSSHHATMSKILTPWPSEDILSMLVEKSSGYFVYAATVIKFVDDKQFRATEQLDIILRLDPTCDGSDSPYDSLDRLYIHILRQVPIRFRPRLLAILSLIGAGWWFRPAHIDLLFGFEHGDAQLTLRRLHSILSIDDGGLARIQPRHASFVDFLLSERRSCEFHITQQHRLHLARCALKIMSWTQLPETTHWAWCVTSSIRSHSNLLTLASMQAGG